MDPSTSAWLIVLVAGGTLFGIPAVAWVAWLRRARPRPRALLIIALVTTLPLVTGLTGAARCVLAVRSWNPNDDVDPSPKARLVGETITFTMDAIVWALIGAAVMAAVVIAASRWQRRHRRP